MIVVDTNIIAYLFLPGERTAQVEQLLRLQPQWAAPLLWRSELCNILALYLRKGILSRQGAQSIMDQALLLLKGREFSVSPAQVLDLCAASSCSAYDCEFVALARDLAISLVTVDREILRCFPETALALDNLAPA